MDTPFVETLLVLADDPSQETQKHTALSRPLFLGKKVVTSPLEGLVQGTCKRCGFLQNGLLLPSNHLLEAPSTSKTTPSETP